MTLHPISGKSYLSLLLLLCASLCAAQTTVPVTLSPAPIFQAFTSSGAPLAFGCVFTYQSQTTTPLATYSDFSGGFPNQNPVLLNASGQANIWLQSGQAYTLVVKAAGGTSCSQGSTVYTVDGVGGGASQLTTTVNTSTGSASMTVQSQNQLFVLNLTGNVASQPLTFVGVSAPALVTFAITQDFVGTHAFTWPSNVLGGGPIDQTPNFTTQQTFLWNGTTIQPVGLPSNSLGGTTWFESATANPAAAGIIRLADTDQACWRNHAHTADICVSKNTSDQLVLPTTIATSFNSPTASPAGSGIVRLADADTVCWRNHANSADICISKNTSDQLVLPTLLSPTISSPTISGTVAGGATYTSPVFGTGISNDGSGFKHKRFGATCSTAASIGASCTTTYSWTTAFADANYTPMCTPQGTTQSAVFSINGFTATGITVQLISTVAAASSYGQVDCYGVHD